MPIGTDAWTSSTIVVIAVACALIGVASRRTQLRDYDETIAKLLSTLDRGFEADAATDAATDADLTAGAPTPLDGLAAVGADDLREV